MQKTNKKQSLNLKAELIEITEKYKQILEIKKEIVKKLKIFLDNEDEIKPQIEYGFWIFENEIDSLIKRLESEGKNNNLISFFLENLKKEVK